MQALIMLREGPCNNVNTISCLCAYVCLVVALCFSSLLLSFVYAY